METVRQLLTEGLRTLGPKPGICSADSLVPLFSTYLQELKRWNRAYNLTGLESDRDIITKHFLDSLLYLTFIPEGSGSLADVGSGAGFPGVPLAAVRPELTVVLIEPSRKKTAFLKHLKRVLTLDNVEIVSARVEEMRDRSFDMAVTRALFTLGDFIKKAGHVVKKGGFLLASKGPRLSEELKDLPASARYEIRDIPLPLTSLERHLVRISLNAPL
ncbi:MAG: 16S rRNA (guanine(527)-N(7))-methyltransferase RsmG [Nitrospirales bacterium]|nr:16S rRNA (guanine(527)-N(7))-methyltransferase RsmG [Nitrospirales bacterium]